jgi:hypothetical protein
MINTCLHSVATRTQFNNFGYVSVPAALKVRATTDVTKRLNIALLKVTQKRIDPEFFVY